jgi:hypothetical protein
VILIPLQNIVDYTTAEETDMLVVTSHRIRYRRQRVMAKLPNMFILTNVKFNIKFKVLFCVCSFLFCILVIYHSTQNQSLLVLFGDT